MPPVKAPLDQIDGESAQIRRNKIQEQFMAAAFDNSDRRQIGKGLVGRVLNRTYRSKRMESYVKKQIDEIEATISDLGFRYHNTKISASLKSP